MSTSLVSDTGEEFASQYDFPGSRVGAILRLHVPQGMKALYVREVSLYPREYEMILPRDVDYKIIKTTFVNGRQIIDAEVLHE